MVEVFLLGVEVEVVVDFLVDEGVFCIEEEEVEGVAFG